MPGRQTASRCHAVMPHYAAALDSPVCVRAYVIHFHTSLLTRTKLHRRPSERVPPPHAAPRRRDIGRRAVRLVIPEETNVQVGRSRHNSRHPNYQRACLHTAFLQGKPDCWRGDACRGDGSPRYTMVVSLRLAAKTIDDWDLRSILSQCFLRQINAGRREPQKWHLKINSEV
ncbi:hypothetical protein EVAR_65286_1 [Eumeta japonica]|uniref:Uncharacterized protein n=1 Tax=Eumeta variegata TaxID=151549 RepID=A0A4C1ZQ02_EUMVA|nr:hypothetical protein EVAR_65286_1 [Eumeta japonica]